MEFKSQCLWKQTYKIIHKNNENGTENKVIGKLKDSCIGYNTHK